MITRTIPRIDTHIEPSELLFILLNLVDMCLTLAGIHIGLKEQNPVMAWLLNHQLIFCFGKMLGALLVIKFVRYYESGALYWANFIVLGVIIWNIFNLFIASSVCWWI